MRHSSRPIVPRAEAALLLVMGAGFLLVLQWWSFALYRVGLLVVIVATLLNIAVGNLPRDAGPRRAMIQSAVILAVVAAIFVIGILLVPVLASLGQGGDEP
ncbi:hypothetical protein [Rhizosaccharibacter radicis]|uniref:AI-2E family transporter n=1 Tax=Rhizosaccharibacter radicis TaxID=2782605 RepID=A0ABT1W2N2_9PROT|nr:hypothetical protein [Acetobacteraceae bacterium KSS12]